MGAQYRAEHLNISPLANEDVSNVFSPVSPVVSVGQRAGRAGMPAGGDLNGSPAAGRSGPFFWALNANRARFSAYLPTPTMRVMPMMSTTSRKWSSQASSTGSISALGRLSGVMFCPRSPRARGGSGSPRTGSQRSPRAVPYISSMRFHNLVPETSWRSRSIPTMGRLGWAFAGVLSSGLRFGGNAFATSVAPKGTPVWAMPHGPGFMPSRRVVAPSRPTVR